MRNLRIYAAHFGMIEGGDEREIRSRDRKINVPARFIRLGLKRKSIAILLADRIFAEEIDGLAKTLDGFDGVLRRIRFHALAPAPEHINLRAKLGPQVHRPHRFLDGESANPRVVAR